MTVSNSFTQLLCGPQQTSSESCEIASTLHYFRGVIASQINDLSWVFAQDPSRISRYAPFLARAILELGATALIARLDPTRILFVKRTQQQPSYTADRSWKTAIRWTGDVIAEKTSGAIWDKSNPEQMTRALLGDYYASLYWQPALERLADAQISGDSEWLTGLRALTVEAFIGSRRGNLIALYSQSSKAIHHEYVFPTGMIDRDTSIVLILAVLKVLTEFAVLLNLLPHVPYRLDSAMVFSSIREIEGYEVGK